MAKLKGSVGPMSMVALLREVRKAERDSKPLAVAGARELRVGGDPLAVLEQETTDAAALIWVGDADEERLRAASRQRIPIIAVSDAATLPYVLADDIVRVPPGQGFPIERIAEVLARRLDDEGLSLAARLPVLRNAVTARLITAASRRNGLIGVAVFIPGVDMPILTFNQLRMVLRIALAHGEGIDRSRAVELLSLIHI